jgi:uncharacterized repeat protein (TIGR01451 family)
MKMLLRPKKCLSLVGLALAFNTIVPATTLAGELEFSSGSYSGFNGPVSAAGPANFLENTTGTTFIPYTPNISVSVSISNQQYPNGLLLGTTGSGNVSPILNRLNFYGGPTDSMFTSNPNGPIGTGISGANNYAFQFFASVDPLAGQLRAARYYYADITLTFSQPVSDPVLHMTGMGGSSSTTGLTPHGHTSEFELVTPNITLTKLSGSSFLNVVGNQILNNASAVTAACNTGAACGSVKFSGSNITSLTFKVYVRGDSGTTDWFGGDVFLFGATSIAKPVTISGTVFQDANGLTDNIINGTGSNAGGLFAILVADDGKVVASTAVAANGSYSFLGIGRGNYQVILSNVAGVQGTNAPLPSLPANWSHVGEGTVPAGDGTSDGQTNISVGSTNLTGVNFGIQQLITNQPPETNDLNPASQTNPGGTNQVPVSNLSGSDPEDGVLGNGASFKIVTLPTNGVLYYNGTIVTAGQTINNYDPTKLTIDPNDGAITVDFTYAAIDSAGLVDPTPATVLMPFTSVTPITCPPGGLGTGSGYATGGNGQYITKNSIYWLDWSCGAATRFNPGDVVTKTWTAPNGISITATLSEITKALTSYRVGAYAGDRLDDLYSGVNPIGLANLQYGEDPNYKISFTMSLNGRPIPADIVTAEAESTDGPNESATWITDGDPWEIIEVAPNSSLDSQFSNGGKTLFMSDSPDRGFGSILAITENVSNINVQMNAGGKEAIAFGIMVPFDYGDAPASYGSAEHYARRDASGGSKPTTLTPASNLTMATLNFNTPYLGTIGADPETANQPTPNADGDQVNGVNDEDAFTVSPSISTSGTYRLNNIPVNNTTGSNTTLYAWIDFNKNGVFEANEFSSTIVANNVTIANLSWTVPTGTTEGTTYARFRITSDLLADDPATTNIDERSTATAINGEVEDYRVTITLPNVLLVKRITAINGQTKTFNGTNLAAYQDDPANPYDDNGLQAPPPFPADTQNWPTLNTFMLGNTNGDFTRPNDELEYTIYFLSTGSAAAKNVLFCDRVPTNVTFMPTAFNSQPAAGGIVGSDRGILAQINGVTGAFSNIQDGDSGQYFPPGSNPASVYPNINCGGNNTNGAIVVNLGTLPNATAPATPGSYGWVRFKGKVK